MRPALLLRRFGFDLNWHGAGWRTVSRFHSLDSKIGANRAHCRLPCRRKSSRPDLKAWLSYISDVAARRGLYGGQQLKTAASVQIILLKGIPRRRLRRNKCTTVKSSYSCLVVVHHVSPPHATTAGHGNSSPQCGPRNSPRLFASAWQSQPNIYCR